MATNSKFSIWNQRRGWSHKQDTDVHADYFLKNTLYADCIDEDYKNVYQTSKINKEGSWHPSQRNVLNRASPFQSVFLLIQLPRHEAAREKEDEVAGSSAQFCCDQHSHFFSLFAQTLHDGFFDPSFLGKLILHFLGKVVIIHVLPHWAAPDRKIHREAQVPGLESVTRSSKLNTVWDEMEGCFTLEECVIKRKRKEWWAPRMGSVGEIPEGKGRSMVWAERMKAMGFRGEESKMARKKWGFKECFYYNI